jgi:hypothetical protein
VVPRFGIGSLPGPLNFHAAITKANSAPMPARAKITQRRSSRRCCRRTVEVRRTMTGSRGSSPSAA